MEYVRDFLSLLPQSQSEFLAGWKAISYGGINNQSCVPGTQNAYQVLYEPKSWGCKNGSIFMDGRWFVETQNWMGRHYEVPLLLSLIYVIVIFGLQAIMKNRTAFSLRPLLFVWNFLLAAFSIAGSYYVVPAILNFTKNQAHGDWRADFCTVVAEYDNPWVFFFIISKIPELLDTLFLALRKRPIIFLHWYHHIATMLYCWDAWSLLVPAGGSFAAMNLVVHSLMYSYYCVMTTGIRLPGFLATIITSIQIFQMIGGIFILTSALKFCPSSGLVSDERVRINYYLGLLMYASYAFLFIKFFVARYTRPSTPQKKV